MMLSMIALLQPMPVGNAARVLLAPPPNAERWKVLRKLSLPFTGHDDADAVVVYDGDERFFIDTQNVKNGVIHHYAPFYLVGAAWVAGEAEEVTPAATLGMAYPDALELIRSRLSAGLKVEVEAGRLAHSNGKIPCFAAPPQYEGATFPIITVQLKSSAPAVRAIGEHLSADVVWDDDEVLGAEGWIARLTIEVIGWVVNNPDTRVALRVAVAKVLLGNLAIFDRAAISEFEFSQSDTEDFESYNAPMFQTITTITCMAPVAVTAVDAAVEEVTVTATPYQEIP